MDQASAIFMGVVPAHCEVRYINETRGHGLFALKEFNKGDVVFTEKALVSIQQAYNRYT